MSQTFRNIFMRQIRKPDYFNFTKKGLINYVFSQKYSFLRKLSDKKERR